MSTPKIVIVLLALGLFAQIAGGQPQVAAESSSDFKEGKLNQQGNPDDCSKFVLVFNTCLGISSNDSTLMFSVRSQSGPVSVLLYDDEADSWPQVSKENTCATNMAFAKKDLSTVSSFRVSDQIIEGSIPIANRITGHMWYVVIASCDGSCPTADYSLQFENAGGVSSVCQTGFGSEVEAIRNSLSLSNILNLPGVGVFGVVMLYLGFVIFLLLSVVFFLWATRWAAKKKLAYYLLFLASSVAMLSYLMMASGHGAVWARNYRNQGWAWDNPLLTNPNSVAFYDKTYDESPVYPVFYAKYINWLITTPLVVWGMGELGSVGSQLIFFACSCSFLVNASFLVAAFILTPAKYGLWFFGLMFTVPLIVTIMKQFHTLAAMRGSKVAHTYRGVSALFGLVSLVYPWLWILTDGSHALSGSVATLFFTACDVVRIGVLGLVLLHNKSLFDTTSFDTSVDDDLDVDL